MSHVDDGALHTYLDGALDALPGSEAERIRTHLESCEECARRLEEERSLRAEAAVVLAGASPGVGEIPPFEELVREARARSEPRQPGGRFRDLALAASLVIGLGSGWMLRGVSTAWVSTPERSLATMERRADEAAVEVREPEVQEPEAKEEVGAEAVGSGATVLLDEATRAAQGVGAMEREGLVRADEMEDAPATPPSSRGAVISPVRADSFAVAVPEEVRASAVDGREASRDQAGRGLQVTDAADSLVGQVARQFAARQERAREIQASPSPVAAPAAPAPEAEADRLAASEATAPGSLVVPGLDVVEVSWLGGEGLAGVVRVLQVLESGDTVELLHLPAGTDPSVLEPLDAGRSELVVPRGAGWLVVRGSATREVLDALVARMGGV